jgi:tetraacyldisaccharide 4'-kinase
MRFIRFLLFPFSILYAVITGVRNVLFDFQVLETYTIPRKSILVGNLSVGGTGKTPHVSYLIDLLKDKYKVGVLSRGYGRDSKGCIEASEFSSSNQIGDEPLFYFKKFKSRISVTVSESRKTGVISLINTRNSDVVLLDDAFQHRRVKAGLSILLTDFNKPFYSDYVMPLGTLRESRSGFQRADIIVVTKCPNTITEEDKQDIKKRIKFNPSKIYFSSIRYQKVLDFNGKEMLSFNKLILVTGIANYQPLKNYLLNYSIIQHFEFSDHYTFDVTDIQKIHVKFDEVGDNETIILTTEKDYMRLNFSETNYKLDKYPWSYIPIEITIDRQIDFETQIMNYVNTI